MDSKEQAYHSQVNKIHKMSLDAWYKAFESWCNTDSMVDRRLKVTQFDQMCGIELSKTHMDRDDRWFWFMVTDAGKFAVACIKWGWAYT